MADLLWRGRQWRDHGGGGQAAQDGSELYYLALDRSMMSASALSCGNSTMADVFVAYNREDHARIAPSADALERSGLSLWWDEIIPADASWRQTILRSLDLARCVVVVWSTLSVSASGEFVQEEADRARSRQVLLPIRIEDVMEPLRFGSAQSLDLIEWDAEAAQRFADLALDCVHKEYPNKIAHVLNSDQDVLPPRDADAGVLRLLRLAFVGARPLAAGAPRADLPERAVRGRRARRAGAQPDAGAHRRRSPLPRRPGPHVVRAAVRPRLAAATRRRAEDVGRRTGARLVRGAGAARNRGRCAA